MGLFDKLFGRDPGNGYDESLDNPMTDEPYFSQAPGEEMTAREMLGSFGISHTENGSSYFVRGDHFDRYMDDRAAPEPNYTAYPTPIQRDIAPSLIEGISLGPREAEVPDEFWSQHERGGTAESFEAIAGRIPDVRERLAAGESIDAVAEDPELSECADLYFINRPKVVERDGYYEFDGNGRHRILAARALGHDIPVDVIGSYESRALGEEAAEADGEDEFASLYSDEGPGMHPNEEESEESESYENTL